MLKLLFISSVLALSCAKPHYRIRGNLRNVIQAPTNCPEGQEWINGQCKDVFRSGGTPPSLLAWGNPDLYSGNVIPVPDNCPDGQEYINGQCRDIWHNSNIVNSNVLNQLLEMLLSNHIQNVQQSYPNGSLRNILEQCQIGYKHNALGICRPIP